MSNSAAAFADSPSVASGILAADTYDPISLHTADVHVLLSGHAAQVTLSLEYVNETNRLVKAIAAYPVPPGFQLQYTTLTGPNRAITDNVYQQSRALRSAEAGGGLPTKSLYDIMTSAVATQTVPWDISPGDSVLMTSVYHAPLALVQRQSEMALTMPTSLFPAVVRPPAEQRNYVKTADDRSSSKRVGKPGWLYLTVEGQLYRPLRGQVTLDKGGYIIVPEGEVELKVTYAGDAGFCLTYQDELPTKAYTQKPLTVRAPVGDVLEPLRLHSVTVPPSELDGGAAAVAATISPTFTSCPVNAELVFLIDVHDAAMAQNVAEAVAAVISPTVSQLPPAVMANVLICSDTRRSGCVALFPTGSVAIASIPQPSVLAYMKEEMTVTTKSSSGKSKKASLAPAAVYSPQLPAVLHDVLTGRNVATEVPDGYVRNILLISDAGGLAKPTESAAMVCDAVAHAANTRVHCVALGPAADRATLESLAVAACGRYRAPATTTIPNNRKLLADCDLVAALRQVIVAAAVPCLTNVRTVWKLASKSRSKATPPASLGTVRFAADASGKNLPCIPRNTKRVLYGLIVPPPPTAATAEDAAVASAVPPTGDDGQPAAAAAATTPTTEEVSPLQLNVRVTGRVGNLSLEFTTSTLITRMEDAIAAAAAASPFSPSAPAAPALDDDFTMSHQEVLNEANSAEGKTSPPEAAAAEQVQEQEPHPEPEQSAKEVTPQETNVTSVSPERDNVSAGSPNRRSLSPAAMPSANAPPKRNGKTLLLHTAAAAARIAYLSNGEHTITPEEAQEMIGLSNRAMLPSPYTSLTDGKAPLSAEQKKGGVVYMPSVGAKAQAALAIRTRQAEAVAAAPTSPSKDGDKEKDGKSSEKDKKKAGRAGKKDTISLYSTR